MGYGDDADFAGSAWNNRQLTGVVMVIPPQSKLQEEALKVVEAYLSDSVQTVMAQNGRTTALKNKKIQEEFRKSMEGAVNEKNIAAIYKNKPAKLNSVSEYESLVTQSINPLFEEFLKSDKDANTVLRGAEEDANLWIQTEATK